MLQHVVAFLSQTEVRCSGQYNVYGIRMWRSLCWCVLLEERNQVRLAIFNPFFFFRAPMLVLLSTCCSKMHANRPNASKTVFLGFTASAARNWTEFEVAQSYDSPDDVHII